MKPSEKLKQIKRQVESTLGDNKDFDFLLTEIPTIIERRTRLGKGVNDGGALEDLKPLSDNYILFRKGEMSFRTGPNGGVFPIFNKSKLFIKKGKKTNGKRTDIGANTSISFQTKFSQNAFKKPKLSPLTRETKSNLTLTGKMLSSIRGIRNGSLFSFFFRGANSNGKTNAEVASYARLKGRPFFDLSTSERNGLQRKISKIIKESIKKLFDK